MHFLHLSHLHFSLASLRDNLPHQSALTVLRRLPVPLPLQAQEQRLGFRVTQALAWLCCRLQYVP